MRRRIVQSLKIRSEVWVYIGDGYGSTNNKIRKFTTIGRRVGKAISYVSSATLGDSWVINESGLYLMQYQDQPSGASFMGISRNSTQLTTGISAITATDAIIARNVGAAGGAHCTCGLFLNAGDVIRAHTEGFTPNEGAFYNTSFRIMKVSA
jgi:hypothetical protein